MIWLNKLPFSLVSYRCPDCAFNKSEKHKKMVLVKEPFLFYHLDA